jgi:hypothetical protein
MDMVYARSDYSIGFITITRTVNARNQQLIGYLHSFSTISELCTLTVTHTIYTFIKSDAGSDLSSAIRGRYRQSTEFSDSKLMFPVYRLAAEKEGWENGTTR